MHPVTPIATVAALAPAVVGCAGTARPEPAPPAASAPASAAAAPSACARAATATIAGVARRVEAEARGGANVAAARRRLARSTALGAAVARADAPATRAALAPLRRAQIRRIVVTRGGRVLASLGQGAALAPVRGVLHDASGRAVGRYVLSVAGASAIASITHEITGASVTIRAGGRTLASAGTRSAAGAGAAAQSFATTAFPRGTARITVGPASVPAAQCGATAAATRAATVAAVVHQLLHNEIHGGAARRVLHHVAGDARFRAAVAADDPVALRAAIIRFFGDPRLHVVRVRAVTGDGRLVGDVGGPFVLSPTSTTVRAPAGGTAGVVTLSIQDDTGLVKLVHRFTGARVGLTTAAGRVPGSDAVSPGPGVVQLTGQAFPTGTLRIAVAAR